MDDRKTLMARLLEILRRQEGPDHPVSMTELFHRLTGETVIPWRRYDQSRLVRSLVRQAREEGHPIAHRAGRDGGYFLARSDAELDETAEWFRKRALASLRQEARLKRISMNTLIEQYRLELNEEA